LMGFICLEEHTHTGEIQWFTEGVTYGSITGPKCFGPRQEEIKISQGIYLERDCLSDQHMSLLQTENREVKLKANLQNWQNSPFPACFACACKSGQDNGFDRKPNKRTRSRRS